MQDMLEVVYEALEVGARGVVFGRNVIQSPDPAETLRAIRAVVHEGKTPREVVAGRLRGRVKLEVNSEKCTGCRLCEYVCAFTHHGVFDRSLSRIRIEGGWPGPFNILACTQCGMCVEACPSGALRLDERLGNVVWDRESCTFCGACAEACPNGLVVVRPDLGFVGICDLCGGAPECERWCAREAIKMVEVGGESRV